jgi:anti-sigma factor RsiW
MCPVTSSVDPTETAEAFVMKRMNPPEAAAYEEHLAHCQACTKVAEETRAFVKAMQDAYSQFAEDDDKQS